MNNSFEIYIDNSKTTSGQKFYKNLYEKLIPFSHSNLKSPKVILFNISVPFYKIFISKLFGKKIILRVDGMYFDKLSYEFLDEFPKILRIVLLLGIRYKILNNYFAFIANFFNRNYGVFLRIFIADHIIFQSVFSKIIYTRYF